MSAGKLGYRDLAGFLRQDPLPRFLALLGPDPDLKEEALERFSEALEPRFEGAYERVIADAHEEPLTTISYTYLVGSLFSRAKLVVLRGFDSQTEGARKEFLKEVTQSELHPSIHLVIPSEGNEYAFPAAFARMIFWPLRTQSEVTGWIKDHARRIRLSIDPGLPAFLWEHYGPQIGVLRAELDKAHLYSPGKPLDSETFTRYASRTESADLFEVLTRYLTGQPDLALRGLKTLWDQGEPPMKVASMLLSQMRKVLMVRILAESNPEDYESLFGAAREHARTRDFWRRKAMEKEFLPLLQSSVSPEDFQGYFEELKALPGLSLFYQASLYSTRKARLAYRELIDLDRDLKVSGLEPEIVMDRTALKLAHILQEPARRPRGPGLH